MTPYTVMIVLVAIALVLIAAGEARSWCRRTQKERLQAEAEAHLPIRRRIKLHVRFGPRTATEHVQEGRFGWWWIWADVKEEVMGVAWTQWGARRQMEAYLRHRANGTPPPRHVVVQRVKPPRRRPLLVPRATVPPEAAT